MAVLPEGFITMNVYKDPNTWELVNTDSGKRLAYEAIMPILDNAREFLKMFTLKYNGQIPNLDKAIDYYGH